MKNTIGTAFGSASYGFRRELSLPGMGFFERPFFFRAASRHFPEEQKALRGLCGVWFFHSLDHTFQLTRSNAFISRINLSAVAGMKIIPDPLYDGKASIVTRPLPPSWKPDQHFVEECPLPESSVEVWDGSRWITKETVTDGGDAIHDLIRNKCYRHPLEQMHGTRAAVIKLLYPALADRADRPAFK